MPSATGRGVVIIVLLVVPLLEELLSGVPSNNIVVAAGTKVTVLAGPFLVCAQVFRQEAVSGACASTGAAVVAIVAHGDPILYIRFSFVIVLCTLGKQDQLTEELGWPEVPFA